MGYSRCQAWAGPGLNWRPLPCRGSALPLRHPPWSNCYQLCTVNDVLRGVILVIIVYAVLGRVGGTICLILALAIGLPLGRRWGFNQLGAFEGRERMRRARAGGWGIF